jgi:SH3 domain-containing YSC84-like protein 1
MVERALPGVLLNTWRRSINVLRISLIEPLPWGTTPTDLPVPDGIAPANPKTGVITMLKPILILGMGGTLLFAREEAVVKRLQDAANTFQEIMSIPDKAIPTKLLNKAQCIIIVPGMKKAALGVGGVYGRGFVSCLKSNSRWGPPAGIRLAGGSFGLQLGIQSTDVVMLVMNRSGVDRLLSDKFTVGVEAAAAAGPIGRDAAADTDILMRAEILSWSRSRGIFAGVSLDGTVVTGDTGENEKLYGKSLTTKEIVEGDVKAPPEANVLLSVLEKYAPPVKKG